MFGTWLMSLILLAQDDKNVGEPPPFWAQLLPFILIFMVMYFVVIMPARRRERQQREMLFKNLKKNDEVVTNAGIIGIVANIKENEDEVTLKVDESSNVRLRVLKSSIVRIVSPKETPKEGDKS